MQCAASPQPSSSVCFRNFDSTEFNSKPFVARLQPVSGKECFASIFHASKFCEPLP